MSRWLLFRKSIVRDREFLLETSPLSSYMPACGTASTGHLRPGLAPLILGGPVKVTCACNVCYRRIFIQPEKRQDSYSSFSFLMKRDLTVVSSPLPHASLLSRSPPKYKLSVRKALNVIYGPDSLCFKQGRCRFLMHFFKTGRGPRGQMKFSYPERLDEAIHLQTEGWKRFTFFLVPSQLWQQCTNAHTSKDYSVLIS